MNKDQEDHWIKVDNIARFEVRIGDINYGGHMGNDKSLLLFQDARIRFLESLGNSEKNIGSGCGIILSEAGVVFKKEVFLHDELAVDIAVKDVTSASFSLEFTVKRMQDQAVVMIGFTKQLSYNYEIRKVSRLPKEFLNKIRI
jgi:acyl-CoA thioester hydrolase